MKNTYLIYKDPKAEKKELIVATPKQWDEIIAYAALPDHLDRRN